MPASPVFLEQAEHIINLLRQLETRVQNEGVSRLIVARPSLQELKRSPIPDGIKVIPKKLKGQRKPVRGRRRYGELRQRLATWPKDHLDENPYPFLAYVVSGQVDFQCADYVLQCKVGDWLMVPAGIPKEDGSLPHFYGDCEGRQGDVLWIASQNPESGVIGCWVCRSRGEEHCRIPNSSHYLQSPFLVQLCKGLYNEVLNDNRPEVTECLLGTILLFFRNEVQAGRSVWSRGFLPIDKSDSKDPIEQAQVYITEHANSNLTIENVAREVAVSPATLTRHFRRHTGQSFMEFLTDKRMEKACQLLQNTNHPVKLVSKAVGLGHGRLRVLFRKRLHCTPSEYRDNSRQSKKLKE